MNYIKTIKDTQISFTIVALKFTIYYRMQVMESYVKRVLPAPSVLCGGSPR